MQWSRIDEGWRWRFALWPIQMKWDGPERRYIWLEWYQSRPLGMFIERRQLHPTAER